MVFGIKIGSVLLVVIAGLHKRHVASRSYVHTHRRVMEDVRDMAGGSELTHSG